MEKLDRAYTVQFDFVNIQMLKQLKLLMIRILSLYVTPVYTGYVIEYILQNAVQM